MISKNFLAVIFIFLCSIGIYAQNKTITIEAEKAGSIGSDFQVATEGGVTYVTPKTDYAGLTNPGSADKILIFNITFPSPGTYVLYIKLRVGPETYNDDSFYFANSFGPRPVNVDSFWVRVNGIDYGATNPDEYVLTRTDNTAGFQVFKWINASLNGEGAAGGTKFVVEADSLTKTFQIGSRENGLDIDKIAFGDESLFYTVSNLDKGEDGVAEIPTTTNNLTVDLSTALRPVTHCATGALYGITETIPGSINDLVAPLNPYVYVQPARAGTGFQQPTGAALPVSDRLTSTTGQVMIRLADLCPGWPYIWPGKSTWTTQVTSVINDKIASGRTNYYGYEIWNERHGTWQAGNGDFETVLWKPTYDLIRSLDPNAKIIGPSDSYYLRSRISEFLTFCINNNCLPDIICWHELQGSANVTSHITDYRALEQSLGIGPLEISINEYCHPTHEYEGCPGTSAPFIAKFERNKVNSASISWWFTNLPGRLGSLLTSSNTKGGGWWFYNWYGDMTGEMVSVTPPNENTDGVDGFACIDTTARYASICLGGNYTGSMDVVINGIPAQFGNDVEVTVEAVAWSNKDVAVAGPTKISMTNYKPQNGTITVPVNIDNPLYGYRVFVSRIGGPVDVKENLESLPGDYALYQNYPNPFNPSTTIKYQIPNTVNVNLKVYDMLGREIKTLFEGIRQPGEYNATFDGSGFASGVYLYRLQAGSFVETRKFILLK